MKLKVIGLLVATCVFIGIMVFAYQSMWSDDKPHSSSIEYAQEDGGSEEAQVLKANEVLYNSFSELQKANDNYTLLLVNRGTKEAVDSSDQQVSQAEHAFKNTIDKVEVSNTALRGERSKQSMLQIISSYRQLLKFQSFESANTIDVSPKNADPAEDKQLEMHNQLQSKNIRIAQLERQVKLLQNARNNTAVAKVTPADYQELVAKNKYLDFDLRSVIKSNLALTKEYEALKRTNQELASQLKQPKK